MSFSDRVRVSGWAKILAIVLAYCAPHYCCRVWSVLDYRCIEAVQLTASGIHNDILERIASDRCNPRKCTKPYSRDPPQKETRTETRSRKLTQRHTHQIFLTSKNSLVSVWAKSIDYKTLRLHLRSPFRLVCFQCRVLAVQRLVQIWHKHCPRHRVQQRSRRRGS